MNLKKKERILETERGSYRWPSVEYSLWRRPFDLSYSFSG
jgi:hypothetical protein